MHLVYDYTTELWRRETKEEVMEKQDIEGNKPCDLCWEAARDQGVYAFPLTEAVTLKRCPCGRMIGVEE